MAATGHKGIDVRQTANRLVFRNLLQDSAGAILATGTTTLYLYEVQDDGTLKSYDFNDHTFKATALTIETASMTHRTGNNSTTNTGVWTYVLSTLTGFTNGAVYLARVKNTGASPTDQVTEFQFGSAEGDIVVTAGRPEVDTTALSGDATAADNAEAFFDGTGYAGGSTKLQVALDLAQDYTIGAPYTADQVGGVLPMIVDILAQADLLPLSPAATGDAMTLEAAERTAVANALLDLVDAIETGVTPRNALRAAAAAAGGETTNMGTGHGEIKALGNPATTRIEGDMDADGNRSIITLNL